MSDRPLFCNHRHKITKAAEDALSTSCGDCMTGFSWVKKSKLTTATAEIEALTAKLRIAVDALESYAKSGNWSLEHDVKGKLMVDRTAWNPAGDGYDIAQEALKAIGGEK